MLTPSRSGGGAAETLLCSSTRTSPVISDLTAGGLVDSLCSTTETLTVPRTKGKEIKSYYEAAAGTAKRYEPTASERADVLDFLEEDIGGAFASLSTNARANGGGDLVPSLPQIVDDLHATRISVRTHPQTVDDLRGTHPCEYSIGQAVDELCGTRSCARASPQVSGEPRASRSCVPSIPEVVEEMRASLHRGHESSCRQQTEPPRLPESTAVPCGSGIHQQSLSALTPESIAASHGSSGCRPDISPLIFDSAVSLRRSGTCQEDALPPATDGTAPQSSGSQRPDASPIERHSAADSRENGSRGPQGSLPSLAGSGPNVSPAARPRQKPRPQSRQPQAWVDEEHGCINELEPLLPQRPDEAAKKVGADLQEHFQSLSVAVLVCLTLFFGMLTVRLQTEDSRKLPLFVDFVPLFVLPCLIFLAATHFAASYISPEASLARKMVFVCGFLSALALQALFICIFLRVTDSVQWSWVMALSPFWATLALLQLLLCFLIPGFLMSHALEHFIVIFVTLWTSVLSVLLVGLKLDGQIQISWWLALLPLAFVLSSRVVMRSLDGNFGIALGDAVVLVCVVDLALKQDGIFQLSWSAVLGPLLAVLMFHTMQSCTGENKKKLEGPY